MLYFTFYIRRWGCFGDILGLEADEELPTVWNDVEYCWVAIISLVFCMGRLRCELLNFFLGNESVDEFFDDVLIFLIHLLDGFELLDEFGIG